MARPRRKPSQSKKRSSPGSQRARRTTDDYGQPWISPRSPEARAGRIREKDQDDESDVFERRLEWFRLYHSDRSGWLSDERFIEAVRHAARMEEELPLFALDPGGEPPARGLAIAGENKPRGRARRTKNPLPSSSLGFVGDAFEVSFDELEALEGIDVKVALKPAATQHVELSTIRVFRFDEDTESWVLVPRSGVGRDGSYAWVRAHRPGRYAPVGLPSDPIVLQGVLTLQAFRPQLEIARRAEALDPVLDAVTRLVFAGGELKTLEGDLPGGFEWGELDLPPARVGIDDFRKQLGGLEIPERGLPEWELFEDICPPRWRWPQQGWPWPPWRWPPRPFWPPHLWPFFPLDWQSVGPRNVSGRIKCLAVNPDNGNIVWAGAGNGGVWKTVNGGATWLPMMSQEHSLAIGAIAISPSHTNVLYAATGEDTPGYGPSWPGVGVYKTDTSGGSWTLCAPIPSSRCTRVLIHPTNPDVVYVAGEAGMHKSVDGGASWTTVLSGHVSDALIDPTNPDRLYAGIWNQGIYRTSNAGASWARLASGWPAGWPADWIKLAMGLNGTGGTSFLVAKLGHDSGDIYVSTNALSWSQVATGVEPASYNEWTNMVGVDPDNHNRILAGGVGVSRSTNGTSFSGVGGTHSDHHAVVYSPDDSNVVYMATDGGVYRSTNGGAAWDLRSYQLVATQLYSLGVSQGPQLRLGGATQDQGIIQTTGSGDWVDTGAGNEGGIFVVDPNNDQVVYSTPWSTNLRRSTNGGVSWTNLQNGLGGATVHDVAVRPGNSNELLCVAGGQVFRSSNQGGSWSSVLTPSGAPTRVVWCAADTSVCYVATDSGHLYRSGSAGSSGSWSEPYAAADQPQVGVIAAVAVSHTDANRLHIGYAQFPNFHVFRSGDGGAHWTNASGTLLAGLPNIPVNDLVVHHLNGDVVYAATDVGVFRTQDGGMSWQTFNGGMPRAFVSGLELRRTSRMLYASTMGRGAYQRRVWFA
jgi:hypothetical protein